MSAILMVAGAAILVFLGVAHAALTWTSRPGGGPMMPTDPDVRAAMSKPGGLGLAPELQSTLFKAWVGFNFSHAFGVVVVGALVLGHSVGGVSTQPWFVLVTLGAPIVYLVLAQLYWFAKPRDAIALATMLIWSGMLIELA